MQVHEKSILLVTVPATLLILDHPDVVAWFILTANFRCVGCTACRRQATKPC